MPVNPAEFESFRYQLKQLKDEIDAEKLNKIVEEAYAKFIESLREKITEILQEEGVTESNEVKLKILEYFSKHEISFSDWYLLIDKIHTHILKNNKSLSATEKKAIKNAVDNHLNQVLINLFEKK